MRPLKFRGQRPIFEKPLNHDNNPRPKKMFSSLELPSLISKSIKMKIPQISIQSSNDVRRQLCKVLTFTKNHYGFIQSQLYERLNEEIKAIHNATSDFKQVLDLVNKIFKTCEMDLQEKDVLIAEGKRSQSKYIFITNYIYSPRTICCDEAVVIKCVNKYGIEQSHKRAKNKLYINCIGCKKILLKITQRQQSKQVETVVEKRKKLMDFAIHIASGRYKKLRMDERPINESLQHVKSRVGNYIHRGLQSLS